MGMDLPIGANIELPKDIKIIHDIKGAYIKNPYQGKDMLTIPEAIDAINKLSGMLMVDLRYRKIQPQGDKKFGVDRSG